MHKAPGVHDLLITAARGTRAVEALVPELQRLALVCGQAGSMHGLELLLGSKFVRRKQPCLICFYQPTAANTPDSPLIGAVLLLEYRLLGLHAGLFATADAFGVRNVVGPQHLHGSFCLLAAQFLLDLGARLVLATWRLPVLEAPEYVPHQAADPGRYLYARSTRSVRDTLLLAATAEQTLQTLGKRTRVHLRAARRRFDREFPAARLLDATETLRGATNADLRQLNEASLDVIDRDEFEHQVRSLCASPGGFVLGLLLEGRWIALVGGWQQDTSTWIEWQCNSRGFEKFSIGSVLRTYLLEQEAGRGATTLGFHGGTSHSMLHRFQQTPVADLLVRRPGAVIGIAVALVRWLYERWPSLMQRGNFLFEALCATGLRWSTDPPRSEGILPPAPGSDG